MIGMLKHANAERDQYHPKLKSYLLEKLRRTKGNVAFMAGVYKTAEKIENEPTKHFRWLGCWHDGARSDWFVEKFMMWITTISLWRAHHKVCWMCDAMRTVSSKFANRVPVKIELVDERWDLCWLKSLSTRLYRSVVLYSWLGSTQIDRTWAHVYKINFCRRIKIKD